MRAYLIFYWALKVLFYNHCQCFMEHNITS